MLMLWSIIWLEMVMICSLLTVLGMFIGGIKIHRVVVHFGLKVLLTKIGRLQGLDLEWRLLLCLMDPMISIVRDL